VSKKCPNETLANANESIRSVKTRSKVFLEIFWRTPKSGIFGKYQWIRMCVWLCFHFHFFAYNYAAFSKGE